MSLESVITDKAGINQLAKTYQQYLDYKVGIAYAAKQMRAKITEMEAHKDYDSNISAEELVIVAQDKVILEELGA